MQESGTDSRLAPGSNHRVLVGYAAAMTAAFAAVQAALFAAGIKFETYPLYAFLHFADPALLRDRLLETCLYLHVQPPLFNLFCGIVLKLFPASSAIVFRVVFAGFALGLYAAAFALMRQLGVRRMTAFVLSTIFMASPAMVLYQHWLFYTLPCALLLTVSAVLLYRFLNTGTRWSITGFFCSLFLLAGIRSSYHLLHYLFIFAAVCAAASGYRKRVFSAGLVFLLLMTGLYVKNYALFGFFGTSSIMGKNFYINTTGNMNWEERQRLVREGQLSELALINRWNALDVYPERYRTVSGYEHIPVLRQVSKSHGPHNYNHLAHIGISEQYMRDAMAALRHSPKSFLLAMGVAAYSYFRPASDYPCSAENAGIIRPWKMFCDYVCCGRMPINPAGLYLSRVTGAPPHLFLLIGLPVLFLFGTWCAVKGGAGHMKMARNQRILLGYLLFNILYVAIVGTIFDFNETNRYRFETDPFYLCLLALVVRAWMGGKSAIEAPQGIEGKEQI